MTDGAAALGAFLLLSSIHLVVAGVACGSLSTVGGIRAPARRWVLRLLLSLPLLSGLGLMLPDSARLSWPKGFASMLRPRAADEVRTASSRPNSREDVTGLASRGRMAEGVGGVKPRPVAALPRGRPRRSWRHVLAGSWALAVALLGSRLLWGLSRLHSAVRKCAAASDPGVLVLVRECAEETGLTQMPRVAVSEELGIPFVAGLFRPVVVIPRRLLQADNRDALRFALLHELAHLGRGDSWHLLAESLGVTLYFFHPAMRWAVRGLRDERESLCDRHVVRVTGKRARYASFLVDEVQRRHVARHALALSAGVTESAISRRVERILSEEDQTMSCRTRDLVVTALFAAALLPVLALSGATEAAPSPKTAPRPSDRETSAAVSSALSFSLGVSDLDTPAVQYALFDEDPSPGFATKLQRLKQVFGDLLEKAEPDKRQRTRGYQMRVVWDGLFRTVTGDKVNLLQHHSNGATVARRAGGGVTVSGTVTSTSVATFTTTGVRTFTTATGKPSIKHVTTQGPPRIVPSKKQWLVTKVAQRDGQPVCWCIPLEPGRPVCLTTDNTFDLAGAYSAVMGE